MAAENEDIRHYADGETLDLDTLESHLWEAADILRGSIDAADYKNYIFGLLFLKRINDRFDEETEEIAEEYDVDEETVRNDRDLHEEFWVPERARWDHITAQSSDIGATLNKALEAVEDENDAISDRVLTSVDFNDKERLADSTLEELVTHFDKHRYRNSDLDDPDIFGRAYEYLIRQFADDAGKKGGEFYTPREVVQLLVECVDPEPGDRVYDPACGSGGMLIYSAQHVEDEGGDRDDISLYGQEKNLNTWAIGQMNVLLHELQDATIAKGDTITDPKFVTEHDELEVFDRVVANPPWNQKKWSKDWVQENEPYNRFPFGLPWANRGDWAWAQLILASLSSTGKAGLVIDHGVLTRDSGQDIREKVVEEDLIEAVITLPEKLFYNTDSPGCILVFNKDKDAKSEGKVQFVYAEEKVLRESGVQIFEELSNQNRLTEDAIEKVSNTYRSKVEERHHSRLVDIDEVLENDANLSVERYVDTTEEQEDIDVPAALGQLRSLEEDRKEADERFSEYITSLPELGLDHSQFKTISLGPREMEIPEHWTKERLDSVTDIITRGKQPDYVEEGGIPVLNQSCIYWDGFHEENLKRLDKEAASGWKDKYFAKRGDVLINSTGQGTLGRAIEWDRESDTHAVDSHITRVHPDEGKMDPTFFRYYLESNHGQTMLYVYCVAGSTGQIELSKTDLESMPVILPPIEEQQKISEAFQRVQERFKLEQQIQSQLDKLNQGLLQDLLTGNTEFDADSLEY